MMKTVEICSLLLIPFLIAVPAMLSNASRELPGEHDKFEDLRLNNKIYVDKTHYFMKLLKQNNRFISICRPRCFGKSNFLQTMKSFFQGNQSLFQGLDVHDKHDWKPHPVIYFDFNAMDVRTMEAFQADLAKTMRQIGESYGHKLSEAQSVTKLLDELMYELSGRAQNFESIVVLVDEYDWPVRRNADIDNIAEVWDISRFLREFFLEVKNFGDKIKLLFMTCTAPLQLRSFKSGVDFLKDITYDPEFSDIIGLTEAELTNNFKTHIEKMANQPNETFETIVQNLRMRYKGYCFSKNISFNHRLYNFHSVISAIRNKNITNYWHANEDPKYNMINVYQKEEFRRHVSTLNFFTNYTISKGALETQVDFGKQMPMIMGMVIYGYLTFRGYKEDTDEFLLDFPNEEVREKFIKEVLEPVPAGNLPVNEVLEQCTILRQVMFDGEKCEQFIEKLNQMSFSTENKDNDYNQTTENVEEITEHDYIDRIVRVFHICDIKNRYGFAFFRKDYSLAGTIDLVAEVSDTNQYVIEFEYKKNVESAMKKLINFAKMSAFWSTFEGCKVHFMGINFSEEGGMINEWIKVTCENGIFTNLTSSDPKYLKSFTDVVINNQNIRTDLINVV